MKHIKKSVNVPIIIDNLVPNVDELHYPTVIGMKDIILGLAKEQWRNRKSRLFFRYLQKNNIDFLETEKIVISLLKHRLTSEDLSAIKAKLGERSPVGDDFIEDGFVFLCKALDYTDIEILINSNVIEKTTDDVDFSDFIEREY
tara:strand:- start:23 stop:454 length:432 start_codon:yes stop_codon:yes gene_type:complete